MRSGMKSQDVLPVVASIGVIIVVAILQKRSRLTVAVTATMPLTTSLVLWIVYSANGGDPAVISQFSRGMLLGIVPTVGFLVAIWLMCRAGMGLWSTILSGTRYRW
jgi:hypothetical protein